MSFVSEDTKRLQTQLLLAQMKALHPSTDTGPSGSEPRRREVRGSNPRDLRAMVAKSRKALAEVMNDPGLPVVLREMLDITDNLFLGPPPSARHVADFKKIVKMLEEQLHTS